MAFLNSPDKNGYCCKCMDHKDACTCYVCYEYNLCEESDQQYPQTVRVRGTSTDEVDGLFPVVGQIAEGVCYEQGDRLDNCDNTYDYEIADLTEMDECSASGCGTSSESCAYTFGCIYTPGTRWGAVTHENVECRTYDPGGHDTGWTNDGSDPCRYIRTITVPFMCNPDGSGGSWNCTNWPAYPAKPTFDPEECPAKPCPSDTSACPSSYILKLTGNFPWWQPLPPGGFIERELQWLAPGKGEWRSDQGSWVYPFNVDEEGYFQGGAYVWLVCYGETWALEFEGEPGFSVVPQKENTNDCPALGAYPPIVIIDHPEWTGTATLEEVAP